MAESWPFRFELPQPPPKDATPLTAEQVERELLRQLETHQRSHEAVLSDLIRLYSDMGCQKKAFDQIQRLVKVVQTPEKKAGCYLTMGALMEQMQNFDMAIKYYSQALALEPINVRTWYFINNNLGFCLNHFGRHQEAEPYCRRAIEIDPSRQNAYKNLGVALEGQGDYAGAARCYIRAVQINASDARALGHLESLAERHPTISVDVPEFDQRLRSCRKAVEHAERAWNESFEQQEKALAPMGTDKKPARILCVDDEPAMLTVYKHVLEPHGYEVLTARRSKEALEIMLREPVDLLIQDLVRPDINGIEVYGVMKLYERLQNIPVVVCSGSNEHRQRFVNQYPDAAAVLAKPFDCEHLVDVVQKALRSVEDERQ